ncbi:GNAT family N-acetyltransferase [Streptomyces ficellus]|uniref:GNAT family N-acetyltransferase n=1 Tax=Streptomyces ficellus TaxID=1977088 RepID=A0A6I6FPT7_9ACTN|nr:GNAT family N-acetyltransferase [Streptomyces ficellus]QGV81575.1 GNAT family N-acetyltransferase [Streptomyces ficellus]
MTTTLRPAGPLQQSPDGARSRVYDVCVNSRRVGAVELGTLAGPGRPTGVIRSLGIDAPDRRRGRGTVAALAAEEVLRGWGCGQVTVTVPAGAAVARRMATALGYSERSRSMAKDVAGPPAGVPGEVEVRAMTEEEFREWEAGATDRFARGWAERGMPVEQARAKAEASHREYLAEGLATEGVAFHVAVRDGAVAGHLWTGRTELPTGERAAYVYDIQVAEDQRGRGYGRVLMLFAERIALEAGERRIGLHVFTDNTPAVRLYESLGYRTTRVHSFKPLL